MDRCLLYVLKDHRSQGDLLVRDLQIVLSVLAGLTGLGVLGARDSQAGLGAPGILALPSTLWGRRLEQEALGDLQGQAYRDLLLIRYHRGSQEDPSSLGILARLGSRCLLFDHFLREYQGYLKILEVQSLP